VRRNGGEKKIERVKEKDSWIATIKVSERRE
jgi:hypothetical protein